MPFPIKRSLFLSIPLLFSGLATASAQEGAESPNPQQTLYFGGEILTMDGDQPSYAEALVERDGKIVFVGSMEEALAKYESSAQLRDLKGNVLLPGFLDGHGHMYHTGFMAQVAELLPPPDGPGANFDSLVESAKSWMATEKGQFIMNELGWVIGNGFDDSQLEESSYPTAEVLDRISTEYPVLFIHQSGHLAVVNTKALELIGYDKNSEDPKGGLIRRYEDGSPNGVLEEAAYFNPILPLMTTPSAELQARSVQQGQEQYAKNGYTTAQDGRSTSDITSALAVAARTESLFIDVVAYPDIIWNRDAIQPEFYRDDRSYSGRYRIGGVKLTLDGSPQGKTAWLTHPYHVPPAGAPDDYIGYPIMSDEDATKYMKDAFENRWQLQSHTNGDAAIDQFLLALSAAQVEFGYPDHRTMLIHGQTLRNDQIPDLVRLEVFPSLYPMHTFYWGDWHVESVLGHPRADYISPTRDVVDAGLMITSHHDAPVTFPNSMRVLDATVNRVTRSGVILGRDQRLTPYEGLKTLTDWAAHQYFEEATKGTLTEGKLADFVILSENPLSVAPLEIKDIVVLETIKEGKTVFLLPP